MATTQLELVTPEALLMSDTVGMVVVPGVDGDFGVMADHAPTVSTLRPGVVSIHADSGAAATKRLFVGGGVAEISSERCIILAEEAVDLANLDKSVADSRLSEAQAALSSASSDGEKALAEAELAIAEAQVAALG